MRWRELAFHLLPWNFDKESIFMFLENRGIDKRGSFIETTSLNFRILTWGA
jgi:hypothetical protein